MLVSFLACWHKKKSQTISIHIEDLRLEAVPMKMQVLSEMMPCWLVNSFYLPEEFSASMFTMQVTDYFGCYIYYFYNIIAYL